MHNEEMNEKIYLLKFRWQFEILIFLTGKETFLLVPCSSLSPYIQS